MQIEIWAPQNISHMDGWMDGWMNGWMDMFQDISDEVSLLFTRQNFPRQGPAKDRCFNGAPCFFNWPCWSLSTCCFKKSTVWRPFVAS